MRELYYHREHQELASETIFGGDFIEWLYKTPTGAALSPYICQNRWAKLLARILSFLCDFSWSSKYIRPLISQYHLETADFLLKGDEEEIKKSFHSLNEFSMRKFRWGKRPFIPEENIFPAFAEGRYFAYPQWTAGIEFPVKGEFLSPMRIFEDPYMTGLFAEGPLFIARMGPWDYHRFHFPDEGRVVKSFRVQGHLNSLSPCALGHKNDIYCTNERQVTLLQTEHAGLLAFVEVIGLGEGRVRQTHRHPDHFAKGEEKGCFSMGESTVLVFAQKGMILPDQDLIENTQKGHPTLVKLGTGIGKLANLSKLPGNPPS